jgi:hypothetical protein
MGVGDFSYPTTAIINGNSTQTVDNKTFIDLEEENGRYYLIDKDGNRKEVDIAVKDVNGNIIDIGVLLGNS